MHQAADRKLSSCRNNAVLNLQKWENQELGIERKKQAGSAPLPSCKPIRYHFICSIKHKQKKKIKLGLDFNGSMITTSIYFFATNFLIHSCQIFFCWKDWEEWCFLKHCHGENKPLISRVQQSEGLQNFLYIKIYQDGN